jgi:hypothetical protein
MTARADVRANPREYHDWTFLFFLAHPRDEHRRICLAAATRSLPAHRAPIRAERVQKCARNGAHNMFALCLYA